MGIFDGITKNLPPLKEYLDFMFENKQGSLVGSRKEEEKICHGIYCDLNCFTLIAKILSILTHFILNSLEKQRQSSELSSGTRARPQISTYLQSVGRRPQRKYRRKRRRPGR